MKVYLSIILVLFLAGVCSAQVGYVTAENAALRSLPNQDAPIISILPNQTRILVKAKKSLKGWYQISFKNKSGWLHGNTFSFDKPTKGSFDNFVRSNQTQDRWISYSATNTEILLYNPSRITRERGLLQVWIKSINAKTYVETSKRHYEINCRQTRYRSLAGVEYDSDGSVRRTWDTPRDIFESPIPETIGEALVIKMCK